MKNIKHVFALFAPAIFLYIIMAIAHWEINPKEMDEVARLGWAFLSVIFGVISLASSKGIKLE